MEPNDLLYADPLDILFENRNKSYGAYTLRKFYPRRLYISFGVICSLVIISSFLYLYFQSYPVIIKVPIGPDVHLDDYTILPPVKPVHQPARPSTPKPPASVELKTPVITADRIVPKPMATIDDLSKSAVGLTTTTGTADNGEPQIMGNSSGGTAIPVADSAGTKTEILDRAEQMPEFPGGVEGLKRYLLKNLHMPENNLESGTEVHVMARFIVDADGRVGDIEITQPADAVFNVEVKRVISKMPDWKRGMQHHRHVAVYFSLPVNFVNAE
jgi:periplasmic protein TonB